MVARRLTTRHQPPKLIYIIPASLLFLVFVLYGLRRQNGRLLDQYKPANVPAAAFPAANDPDVQPPNLDYTVSPLENEGGTVHPSVNVPEIQPTDFDYTVSPLENEVGTDHPAANVPEIQPIDFDSPLEDEVGIAYPATNDPENQPTDFDYTVLPLEDEAGTIHPAANDADIQPSSLDFPASPLHDEDVAATADDSVAGYKVDEAKHRVISSLTTHDQSYFPINLNTRGAHNPNIIPHPTKHDMHIVVAQGGFKLFVAEELTCAAAFHNDVLVCADPPDVVPVAPSVPPGRCEGSLTPLNVQSGPRDARVFWGPNAPYIVYGSRSQHACFGQWIQDIRPLFDAFQSEQVTATQLFVNATELRRPPPYSDMEKNFFIFWSNDGKAYVHTDIFPSRVFALLDHDGSVGENLAPMAEYNDKACMAKYMPVVGESLESIHQATNSLSITLCNRLDPQCIPDDSNTFLMHIFQYKTFYSFHAVYEPYVVLFNRSAPFGLLAISQRPLWIRGRGALTLETGAVLYEENPQDLPEGHTEMFYITSMSWKTHGQKYHGFADDPLFLAFGIEDSKNAGIDILAKDLLQDLAYC